MQVIIDRWMTVIEGNADYCHVVATTKPGKKKRQEQLSLVVDPFEEKVMKEIEAQGLGKKALSDYLGSELEAHKRANKFGFDFILSVEVPGFDALNEMDKEHVRYQHAIREIVWQALIKRLMVPELHAA